MSIQNPGPNRPDTNGSAPARPTYPVTNGGDAVKAPFRVPNLHRHPYSDINPRGDVRPIAPPPVQRG
jgi:hypothetical protein